MTRTKSEKFPAKKILTYEVCRYDVWGNARDGWDVNDVWRTGEKIHVTCKRERHNAGTAQEFSTYVPTDRQLNRALGARGLVWDGETEHTLFATHSRSGKPVGELRFVGES